MLTCPFFSFKNYFFIQIISSIQFFEHRNELKNGRKKAFIILLSEVVPVTS